MFDQYGRHIPGTSKPQAKPKEGAKYKKYDQVGSEAFFVKKNPLTGVTTRMVYDHKTGTVKVQKTVKIDADLDTADRIRNHAASKRAYAGHGVHQIAWYAPNIVVQEMKEKAGLDASGNYDLKEFNRMLNGTSKHGDYSRFKMMRGKMPEMKKEL